jgi:uncharacterized membrane protein
MRAATARLAALVWAIGILLAASGGAHSQTFVWRVCNKSAVNAAVAVSARVSPSDSRFQVQGWWAIAKGECANIGNFPQGWVYFYAEQDGGSGNVYWGGNTTQICVRYPGPFTRIATANYTCRSDERLRGFDGAFIPDNTGTYTVTID